MEGTMRSSDSPSTKSRDISVTNGSKFVSVSISRSTDLEPGLSIALDPDTARTLGIAMLCGARNVREERWGGHNLADQYRAKREIERGAS